MNDRDFSVRDPTYEPGVHSDIARECLEAWNNGRPWTRIRVLQKGTDNPSGHACSNCQGHFNDPCSKEVEAVQYSSAGASPMFYCEEHALIQVEWDVSMYDGEKPAYEESGMNEGETVGDFVKRGKKNKEPEPEEEYEP